MTVTYEADEIAAISGGSVGFPDTEPIVGTFHSTTQGSGIEVSSTETCAHRVYADDAGAAIVNTGVGDTRGGLARVLLTVDHSANELRLFGQMGQVKTYNGSWNNEMVGGIYGYVEVVKNQATNLTLGGYGITAALMGCVETSDTGANAIVIDTNHILAGVAVVSKLAYAGTLTQTGKTVGLLVAAYNSAQWSDSTAVTDWGYGLYISSAVTAGIAITDTPTDGILISGACADGIHISGICTSNAINISGAQVTGAGIAITSTGTLTGTLKGIAIDYDGVTLGTQNNTGIEVLMHATYGGTGTEYAIYASGDGTTVALCSDAAAAITVGGTVTTGLAIGAATTSISLSGACTTGIAIANTSLDDGILISGTTPVDGLEISSACSVAGINLSGASAIGLNIAGSSVVQGIVVVGGTSTDTGSSGTALQVGTFGTPLSLDTAGMYGMATYFTGTATSGSLTGMRLRTRGNAASGTQSVTSMLLQADVIASKTAQDCVALNVETIAKDSAVLASGGWFSGGQFKVEDEYATGGTGSAPTYGGHVAVLRLIGNISADPTNTYTAVFVDCQSGSGAQEAFDSIIHTEAAGQNANIEHFLTTGDSYATLHAANKWVVNETPDDALGSAAGCLRIDMGGTDYYVPFFDSVT